MARRRPDRPEETRYRRRPTELVELRMGPTPVQPTAAQMEARRAMATGLIGVGLTREQFRQAFVERLSGKGDDEEEKDLDAGERERRRARRASAAVAELGAMNDQQIAYVYESVTRDLADHFDRDRSTARAMQAERLRRDLVRLRARAQEKGAGSPLWHNIARHEELYAKVSGTIAPLKVEVDATIGVRRSLVAVVANMSPAEQDELVAEQARLEILAAGVR